MSKPFFGGIRIENAQEIGFYDSDSSNFSAFKAPAALTGNVTFTLPDGDSTGTQALTSNGSGTLSWASFLDTSLSDGNIYIGNGSNAATAVDTASVGDIDADATGGLTIKAGVIVDADVNASAAITLTKLAATTASRALASDASGFIVASAVTDTELGYLDGVTSAIQTQLDAKAGTALDNLASVAINTSLISDTDNTDDLGSAAIGWANAYANALHMDSNSQTTALQGSASASASVTYSLPPADGTSGFVLSTNGSGALSWVSNASSSSFIDTWVTADTATKAITHSLSNSDVLVQVYDVNSGAQIEIDSIVITDANTVTVTASQAPPATDWSVKILAL